MSARRAIPFAAAALLEAACIQHIHLDPGAPGAPQAASGGITHRGTLASPSDPGEHATVLTMNLIAGPGWDVQDTRSDPAHPETPPGYYTHIGFEITARTLALEQSHKDPVIWEALERQPLRPVIGWTLLRMEGAEAEPRLGPGYFEIVYERPFTYELPTPGVSIGAGAAVDTKIPTVGPQATACFMMMFTVIGGFCLRGAFLPFRGTDVQINGVLRGHFEIFSSR